MRPLWISKWYEKKKRWSIYVRDFKAELENLSFERTKTWPLKEENGQEKRQDKKNTLW